MTDSGASHVTIEKDARGILARVLRQIIAEASTVQDACRSDSTLPGIGCEAINASSGIEGLCIILRSVGSDLIDGLDPTDGGGVGLPPPMEPQMIREYDVSGHGVPLSEIERREKK